MLTPLRPQYRIATDSKERHMVEADLMKLEVKRLRDVLASRADEVSNLENRKFQLKMNMEERKHEVEVHKEALKVELRLMREDVHRVTMELKDRSMKVRSRKGLAGGSGGDMLTSAAPVPQAHGAASWHGCFLPGVLDCSCGERDTLTCTSRSYAALSGEAGRAARHHCF